MIERRGWLVVFLASLVLVMLAVNARAQQAPPANFCDTARAILKEAKGDEKLAERIARRRGHSDFHISMARRFCSP